MRVLILIISVLLLAQSSGLLDLLIRSHADSIVLVEDDSKKEEKQEEGSSKEADKRLPDSQLFNFLQAEKQRLFAGFEEDDILPGYYTVPGQPPDIL